MARTQDRPEPVLRCVNLVREFTELQGVVRVLKRIDLEVYPGEQIAIIGPSGSGKTALLNLIGGLDVPDEGHVEIAGQRVDRLSDRQLSLLRQTRLGFVYQFSHLLGQFSALDNVAMPLYLSGAAGRVARARAGELLAEVGLAERAGTPALNLSGGERQRVAIARALAQQPSCLLMDEPTGNLDAANTALVRQLLGELVARSDVAVILATHDMELAGTMGRVMRLQEGRLEPHSRD